MRLGRIGFWFRFTVCVIKPPLLLFTRHDWRGQEQVPRTGGVIVAVNHISHVDPFVVADYLMFATGRMPRYLAKSTLFEGRGLVPTVLRGARQIPVHRRAADASLALKEAVAALAAGECVVIYPEGTVSRDPEKWPMVAKTGVARLALLSGAPVLPLAQWGAQEILDSYRTKGLHLFPRHTMRLQAGPPVDLSPWEGQKLTAAVLRAVTKVVMAAVTHELEDLRGQPVPATVFDPGRDEATGSKGRSA